MSGVSGADRIKSRADFDQFLKSYLKVIKQFPGFVSIQPSGSYNSDPTKEDFGDIDLITHINSDLDKKALKKELAAYLSKLPDTVIVPFSSPKYVGRKFYNSGEIITVRYHDAKLGYSVQVDNIIALDANEAEFKRGFLDFPAEIQGLVLGLVKVATIEEDPKKIFARLGIKNVPALQKNQEYEFNLSGAKLELRLVTYEPGTYKQANRESLWQSTNFADLKTLLYKYNVDADFDTLLAQIKSSLKNPRSKNRITGVFNSMISVKSGEVDTPKGDKKVVAIKKVGQVLSETPAVADLLQEYEMFVESTHAEITEPDLMEMMKDFLPLALEELELDGVPKITLVRLVGESTPTFGCFDPSSLSITLQAVNRHPMDILRTLAHEMVHFKQGLDGLLHATSGETGSEHENEANAKAAVIMRKLASNFPGYFSAKIV